MNQQEIAELRKHLKFSNDPSLLDFVFHSYPVVRQFFLLPDWQNYTLPGSFISDLRKYYYVEFVDYVNILFIALFITLLRCIFNRSICKVSLKL